MVTILSLLVMACAPVPPAASPTGGVAASATPSAQPTRLERVTLRFSFTASPVQIAQTYGVVSGIYAKHGFEVTVLESTGSPVTLQVVSAGADHFGFADAGVYALAKGEGLPVEMLGVFAQQNSADVIFFCDKNIKQPTDLKGKTIAAPAGDAVMQLLPALLSKYGLSMSDIKHVAVTPAARIAPVIEGQVDAGVGYGYASTITYELAAERAGKGPMCHLRLPEFGINTLGFGLFTSQRLIDQKPDTVKRFAAAVTEAWEAAVANPKEAVDSMMTLFPNADRVQMERGFKVVIDSLHTEASKGLSLGCVSEVDARQTIELLTQYGSLKLGDKKPTDFFNNRFLPKC